MHPIVFAILVFLLAGIPSCTLQQRQLISDKQQAKRVIASIQFPITRKELYAKLPPIVRPSSAGIIATTGSGSRGTEFYQVSEKVGLAVSVYYRWTIAGWPIDDEAKQDDRDTIEAVEVREWTFELNAALQQMQSQRIPRVE